MTFTSKIDDIVKLHSGCTLNQNLEIFLLDMGVTSFKFQERVFPSTNMVSYNPIMILQISFCDLHDT